MQELAKLLVTLTRILPTMAWFIYLLRPFLPRGMIKGAALALGALSYQIPLTDLTGPMLLH